MEALTRENRYEGGYAFTFATADVEAGGMAYATQGCISMSRCRSCGSLAADTDLDLHERLHPRVGCDAAHPEGIYHPDGHAWEEQFR
jgi:hypothetical protein